MTCFVTGSQPLLLPLCLLADYSHEESVAYTTNIWRNYTLQSLVYLHQTSWWKASNSCLFLHLFFFLHFKMYLKFPWQFNGNTATAAIKTKSLRLSTLWYHHPSLPHLVLRAVCVCGFFWQLEFFSNRVTLYIQMCILWASCISKSMSCSMSWAVLDLVRFGKCADVMGLRVSPVLLSQPWS